MTLLPPNSTPLERALETTTERATSLPAERIKTAWNPYTCPAATLPWLAWSLHVDDWDTNWSEQQKRATIAASIQVHRAKGTLGSLKRAIQALGYECDINEVTGIPYIFRITVNSVTQPLTPAIIDQARSIALNNKPARTYLDRVDAALKSLGKIFFGAAQVIGAITEVSFNGTLPDGTVAQYDSGDDILFDDASPVLL